MNDATDAVGDASWLAPDRAEPGGAPGDFAPDGPPGADPRLAALDGIDWLAWAERDPHTAGAAWRVLTGPAPTSGDESPDESPDDDPDADQDPDRARRLQAVEAELARDIEGWSPQLRADLAAYGQARGFTAEELAGVEDPREVKILHLAMLGEQALAAQRQARLQAEAFGRFRPPTQVGGHGHPGNTPNDRNSTDAWMQARRTQLRKKARG